MTAGSGSHDLTMYIHVSDNAPVQGPCGQSPPILTMFNIHHLVMYMYVDRHALCAQIHTTTIEAVECVLCSWNAETKRRNMKGL